MRALAVVLATAGLSALTLAGTVGPLRAERTIDQDSGFPGFVIDRMSEVPPRKRPGVRLRSGDTLRGDALAGDTLPFGLPDPRASDPRTDNDWDAAVEDDSDLDRGDPRGNELGDLETTEVTPNAAYPSAFGAPGLFEPGSFAPPTTRSAPRSGQEATSPALPLDYAQPSAGLNIAASSSGPAGPDAGPGQSAPEASAAGWRAASPLPYAAAAGPQPNMQTGSMQSGPIDRSVESGDLDPILSSDGSGLPAQLWLGLDMPEFDRLLANLEIPPRSTALFDLWRRLMSSEGSEPAGVASPDHFLAVRLEGLTRAGLFDAALRVGAAANAQAQTPMIQVLLARAALGSGDADKACDMLRPLGLGEPDLPDRLLGEVWATLAYCAARQGSASDAGLVVDMARDRGVQSPEMFKLIDALAAGEAPDIEAENQIGLITWKLLSLDLNKAGAVSLGQLSAAALSATALDAETPAPVRLAAAERAARQHLIAPSMLAEIYLASPVAAADPASALQVGAVDAEGRATLFKTIAAASEPGPKARLIAKMLGDARREGLGTPIAAALADSIEGMRSGGDFDWFAETAIEVNLAAGRYEQAMAWAVFSGSEGRAKPYPPVSGYATQPAGAGTADSRAAVSLFHWLNLIDIAAPANLLPRGANLGYLQDVAMSGAFAPETLHRLVTVLDALGYQIPIPLWEVASRSDQPTSGYLPETGILSELKAAAGQRAHGRVILLAMATLGPDGAEGANLIALGDAIRALASSGLETEARQLAFEALYESWPRLRAD